MWGRPALVVASQYAVATLLRRSAGAAIAGIASLIGTSVAASIASLQAQLSLQPSVIGGALGQHSGAPETNSGCLRRRRSIGQVAPFLLALLVAGAATERRPATFVC